MGKMREPSVLARTARSQTPRRLTQRGANVLEKEAMIIGVDKDISKCWTDEKT